MNYYIHPLSYNNFSHHYSYDQLLNLTRSFLAILCMDASIYILLLIGTLFQFRLGEIKISILAGQI